LNFVITIKIPTRLETFAIRALLYARRIRFGYAFRKIPLTQGRFAIVDPQDYHALAKHKWRICKNKSKNSLYAERSIRKPNGKYSRLLMHRQLITPPPAYCIDHINRNGLDNRRANLRLATPSQNAANSKPRNPRSGYKGVWFDKRKRKYRAAIWHNNKRIHLGYFDAKIEAAKAYDAAARKHHGRFASPNFQNPLKTPPAEGRFRLL
jgi:hypothetical protein